MRRAKPQTKTASQVRPRLLRRTESAAYLSLSPSAFDILRTRGELRAVPVPALRREHELLRVPLFDIADLDALVDRWKANGGER